MTSMGLSQGVNSLGRGAEAGQVAQSWVSAGPGGRGQGLVADKWASLTHYFLSGVASGLSTWELSRFLPGLDLGEILRRWCV